MNQKRPSKVLDRNDFITADTWLMGVLGQHVSRLTVDEASIAADAAARRTEFVSYVEERKPFFAYAKVPAHAIASIAFLEDLGFHLIDTNITFEKDIGSAPLIPGPSTIRPARSSDREHTVRLAERAFQFSRFHVDPCFPAGVADRVKGQWVRSYFNGQRGHAMVVAEMDQRIVGFLQLIRNSNDTLTIDLIGVHPDCRRKGIASALIGFAEGLFKSARRLLVGTQLANVPSLRLYEHLGFRLCSSQYVFHFHSS